MTVPQKIIILGSKGQVGQALHQLTLLKAIPCLALSREVLDIRNFQQVTQLLDSHRDAFIVNATAYTAVDRAEDEAETAYTINAQAVGFLAQETARREQKILHLSTDFVFDGYHDKPYDEDDKPNPLSIYGKSKLAGEEAIIAANPHYFIIRTAWVFSQSHACFPKVIYKLLRSKDKITVVDDQFGNPTPAEAIASMIIRIYENLLKYPEDRTLFGLFHFSGTPSLSRYEFAQIIAEMTNKLGYPVGAIDACSSSVQASKAIRPKYATFSCDKIKRIHGIERPVWKNYLSNYLSDYEKNL
jgi:dTDP-4-dehydrorhamnose reductase